MVRHVIAHYLHFSKLLQLSVLTAVASINEAIENENSTQLINKMNHSNAGLTSVEESLCNRYLSHLMSVKEEKGQVCLESVLLKRIDSCFIIYMCNILKNFYSKI